MFGQFNFIGIICYMRGMFSSCASFNGDISSWNVSNVTGMSEMFSGCKWFSKVTSTRTMFYLCSSYNGEISKWNISNVTTWKGMLYRSIAMKLI